MDPAEEQVAVKQTTAGETEAAEEASSGEVDEKNSEKGTAAVDENSEIDVHLDEKNGFEVVDDREACSQCYDLNNDMGRIDEAVDVEVPIVSEQQEHQSCDLQLPDPSNEAPQRVLDLPPDLAGCVKILHADSCTVYLVGTAHVSQESCKEVEAVIRHVKPQVVFLELCSGRRAMLSPQDLHVPTTKEMLEAWRSQKMNAFGILYSWFLAKIAQRMEVFPGAEFRVAFEEGKACNAKIVLGDRPVYITLQRTWAAMSRWHKVKFLYYMISQAVFLPSVEELNRMLLEMSDTDMITLMIQEMSKTFPTLIDTLLHERDLFMTAMLRKVCEQSSSVVAVVGKGHVSGIVANWDKTIEVGWLMEIPSKKSNKKRWGIAFVAGGLVLAIGIYVAKRR